MFEVLGEEKQESVSQGEEPSEPVVTPDDSEEEENMEDIAPSRVGRKRPITSSPAKSPPVNAHIPVDKVAQESWRKTMAQLTKNFKSQGLQENLLSLNNYFNIHIYGADPSYVTHRDQSKIFLGMSPAEVVKFIGEANSPGPKKRRSRARARSLSPSEPRTETDPEKPPPARNGLSPELAKEIEAQKSIYSKRTKYQAARRTAPYSKRKGVLGYGTPDVPPPAGRPPDSPAQRQSRLTDLLVQTPPSAPSESSQTNKSGSAPQNDSHNPPPDPPVTSN